MRILLISAFYPPYVIGGWEQLVADINQGMRARGHQTLVLTSNQGLDGGREETVDVRRVLTLESDLQHYRPSDMLTYRRRVQANLGETRRAIEEFRPDVVFVHIMWNLTRGIPWIAEQLLPGRVVYYVADHWAYTPDTHEAYWRDRAGSGLRDGVKRLIAPWPLHLVAQDRRRFHLEFATVLCVSKAIRKAMVDQAHIAPERVQVVYNGIAPEAFPFRDRTTLHQAGALKLLYAGSMFAHKGVHTAVEAMAVLNRANCSDGLSLTIVGSGRPDYEEHLRTLVQVEGLMEKVHFLGRVDRAEMPAVLDQFDVLLFPSAWPEPLARMTQEAMACGLAVIGTTTGGTGEILRDGETGLTFAPGDAAMLADRILELKGNPALFQSMTRRARALVEEKFDIQRMLIEMEAALQRVVVATPSSKVVAP